MVWQVAAATGWPVRHILWRVSYQSLALMLADAPGYRAKKAGGDSKGMSAERLFQSKFK